MEKPVKKKLGEILVSSKLVSQENIDKALHVQTEKGGLLGSILVSMNCVTEEGIAQALVSYLRLPYLPLSRYDLNPEAVKLVPVNVAKQYELVAIDRFGSILTLVMSDPLNTQAVEDIEMLTHCKAQIFVSTPSEIKQAIQRSYKSS